MLLSDDVNLIAGFGPVFENDDKLLITDLERQAHLSKQKYQDLIATDLVH